MKKLSWLVVFILTVVAIGAVVNITRGEPKYLDKEGINKTMIQWNKALGVKCTSCHTSDRSQTYKSLAGKTVDEKELKTLVYRRIARAMLGTMLYLNKTEGKNYTCNTCHQGNKEVEVKQISRDSFTDHFLARFIHESRGFVNNVGNVPYR